MRGECLRFFNFKFISSISFLVFGLLDFRLTVCI